jgi:hypothetical protein
MHRFLTITALSLAASSGWLQHSPAPASPAPELSIMTQSRFGYTFVFERSGEEQSAIGGRRNVDRDADGKETLDEDITITCGSQTARILNGKLTADGRDRGSVKPGDTIKLTSSGKLSVNGEER